MKVKFVFKSRKQNMLKIQLNLSKNNFRYYLATHMQPTYARKVFPCYDEPKFKSVFNLTIVHRKGYHAISNMDSVIDHLHNEFNF